MNSSDIIVRDRQREAEIDEHFIASVKARLIHPIVLRQTEEGPVLVVGGRRLKALKALEINPLIEGKHFRFESDLSPEEAEIVELEENVKREDLPWRDHVKATIKIHEILSKAPDWSIDKTAERINISRRSIFRALAVGKMLDSPLLRDASGIQHAYNILQIAADRAAAEAVGQITSMGAKLFKPSEEAKPNGHDSSPNETSISISELSSEEPKINPPTPIEPEAQDPNPIDCISFFDWIKTYSGPKFNLIHCDFPYNIEYRSYAVSVHNTDEDYDASGFDELLESFCSNLDKFCSYSAHILFWFSMEFYESTRLKLETAGLAVQRHPLIWFKSDNSGIIPGRDNQYPRRVYETAFLCSRSKRPLIRQLANTYACPIASNPLHPSQKPEPMLKHFMSMLIDETTDVFDPTAGSGAALRAADALGARRIYGLDINESYVARANSATITARNLRRAIL